MTPQQAYEQEQADINSALGKLIDRQRKLSFTQPDKASQTEALGTMVSKYTGWDGEAIYVVAYEALTDANYHALAAKLKYLWDHPFARAEQLCAAEDARITMLTKAEDEAAEKAIREVFHIPYIAAPTHKGDDNGNHKETEPTGRQIQQPHTID